MFRKLIVPMLVPAALATALLAVPTSSASAQAVVARAYITVAAPPAAIVETVPVRPGAAYVWIGGYHRWDGRRYVWAPGYWGLPPRGRTVWVPGRWAYERRGWYWTGGYWR